MDKKPLPATGRYALILGAEWHSLTEDVRRLHQANGVDATGSFCVRHGNWLARLLTWLARMPAACDAVNVRLIVTPSAQIEVWQRLFAGRPFNTLQWASDGCLIERVGLTETHLQLEAKGGSLHYRTMRVALRVGRLRLPLPLWLAPRITASETADDGAVHVRVDVTLPIIGLLIAYEGLLTSIEARTC